MEAILTAIGTLIGTLIGVLILIAILILPTTWIVMLLLGTFASLTGFSAFAIGFWPTFVLVLIVQLFIVFGNKSS